MTKTSSRSCSRARWGFQIGDRVVVAGPGTLVTKPRDVPHAFWNAGEARARILELISPAGFETYFAAMAELFSLGPREPARAAVIQQRYHLNMDFSSIPRLSAAYGLRV